MPLNKLRPGAAPADVPALAFLHEGSQGSSARLILFIGPFVGAWLLILHLAAARVQANGRHEQRNAPALPILPRIQGRAAIHASLEFLSLPQALPKTAHRHGSHKLLKRPIVDLIYVQGGIPLALQSRR